MPGLTKVYNVYVILLVIYTTHRRITGKYESPGHYKVINKRLLELGLWEIKAVHIYLSSPNIC